MPIFFLTCQEQKNKLKSFLSTKQNNYLILKEIFKNEKTKK